MTELFDRSATDYADHLKAASTAEGEAAVRMWRVGYHALAIRDENPEEWDRGGRAEVAREVGVSPSTLSNRVTAAQYLPADMLEEMLPTLQQFDRPFTWSYTFAFGEHILEYRPDWYELAEEERYDIARHLFSRCQQGRWSVGELRRFMRVVDEGQEKEKTELELLQEAQDQLLSVCRKVYSTYEQFLSGLEKHEHHLPPALVGLIREIGEGLRGILNGGLSNG